MYEDFYHLSADPFRLTPDPRFCFRHSSYNQAWAYLRYAFRQAEGFVMVTGRTGTGKTTLVEAFQKELKQSRVVAARVASTSLEATDLLRAAAYAFAIDVEGLDKATLLQRIEQYLLKQTQCGKRVLLIIDEAQGLPRTALEELRLIADLHTGTRPLLQVFLVGQEKLRALMSAMDMEQFQQRVIGSCHLEAMGLAETRDYVEHRLQRAGWKGDPQLTGSALIGIYRYSLGVPRHVNKICSRLLLFGSLEQKHELAIEDVLNVAAELRAEQLAPLVQGQTAFARVENGDWEPELQEASLSLDDLAIRELGHTTHGPAHATNTEGSHGGLREDARDKVTTLVPRPPPDRREAAADHRSPETVEPSPAPAAQPGVDKYKARLEQIARVAAAVSRHTARTGAWLWHRAIPHLTALWKRIAAYRFAGRFNWQGELVVLVGALVLITLSATGLTMYLGRDAGDRHSLLMAEPTPVVAPPDMAQKEESRLAAKPEALEQDTVSKDVRGMPLAAPSEEAAENLVAQDAAILPQRPELASLEPAAASVARHAAPPVERGWEAEPEPLESEPAEMKAEAVASLQPSVITSEDPVQVVDVDVVEEPLPPPPAVLEVENEDTMPVAVAAVEPLAVETRQPPLPAADAMQERIAGLLALGREARKADRLLIPQEESAYYYYQQVLALEPDNRDALHGMEQIVKRYITLARLAIARQEREKASRYVVRGLRVQPGDRRLVALQDNLRAVPSGAKPEVELPPPMPVEEPPQVVESKPPAENFFSRMKAFFKEGKVAVEEAPIWEE